MGYLIELSVHLDKMVNLTQIKNCLFKKARECKVENYYSNYEFMGKDRHIERNHCILTFKFEDNEELVAEFITFIKKKSHINIESLGYDDHIYKLMYASKKYLKLMEIFQAKKYLEARKKGKLYKQNSIILKAILKKTKKFN